MDITFLVYRLDRERLMTTEFYRQDIEILESLGHRVTVATSLREVPARTELVLLWWWSWLWLVGPYLKLRGIPICVTGSLEPEIYEQYPFYARMLIRWGMRFADRSVFVSRYMLRRLSELMRLKSPRYCPHIVMDEYRLFDEQNTRRLPNVIFNVAWKNAANMHRKMLPELIEAFAIVKHRLPQARLVLAGEPMDGQRQLEIRAAELGLGESVDFLGKISMQTKLNYMQNCGAYYQCSRHEGFGVAIAEAMACGAPVVVNNRTAIPEVVSVCGYYVRDESPHSIARSLVEVLSRPDEARALGVRAAARIDAEFRLPRRREFFRTLFAELIGEQDPQTVSRTQRITNSGQASESSAAA